MHSKACCHMVLQYLKQNEPTSVDIGMKHACLSSKQQLPNKASYEPNA